MKQRMNTRGLKNIQKSEFRGGKWTDCKQLSPDEIEKLYGKGSVSENKVSKKPTRRGLPPKVTREMFKKKRRR